MSTFDWNNDITKIGTKAPVQLLIEEFFEKAYDEHNLDYEDVNMEYVAIGIPKDAGLFEIIIPVHPEKNIDSPYDYGTEYILASMDQDSGLYTEASDKPNKRTFKIKSWQPLSPLPVTDEDTL